MKRITIHKVIKSNKNKDAMTGKSVYGTAGKEFWSERSYNVKRADSTFSNRRLLFYHTNLTLILKRYVRKYIQNLLESLEINKFTNLDVILNNKLNINKYRLLNLLLPIPPPPSSAVSVWH